MTQKASSVERVVQVAHRVVQKSCRRVCQLLCCPAASPQREPLTCCPELNHPSAEVRTTQVAPQGPPCTVLIVNISNSTLINSVIGRETYSSCQAFLQTPPPQTHDQLRCSCSREQQGAAHASPLQPPALPAAAPQSISIHGSHLSCVIIGDNNCLHAAAARCTETDEEDEGEALDSQA